MGTTSSPRETEEDGLGDLAVAVEERFGATLSDGGSGYALLPLVNQPGSFPSISPFLFSDLGCPFGGMIAEEHSSHWQLHYLFLLPRTNGSTYAAIPH